MISDGYSVGEVAALAHVSVRTLHHYDEIGLLRPSGRTGAGHRRYAIGDLARLREILFYRELDFGLDEIATMPPPRTSLLWSRCAVNSGKAFATAVDAGREQQQ